MYWWIPMAAGAVLGAVKNQDDQKAAQADAKFQAVRELWSPFTGKHGDTPKSAPSMMQAVGEGAIGGLAQGQAMENAQVKNDYLKSEMATNRLAAINGLPVRRNLWNPAVNDEDYQSGPRRPDGSL